MKRLLLFIKGLCIGFTDIIPGVSGGTLALILGVYTELVDTIRNLHLRWLAPLWRWLTGGRRREDLDELLAQLKGLNLGFLTTLALGVVVAVIVGSIVIPPMMERFPEAMRGLFFGLILASVVIPFRMIEFRSNGMRGLVGILIVSGAMGGYLLTNPANTYESNRTWVSIESRGESLEDILRRGPSAMTGEKVYWAPENEAFRQEIARVSPALAQELAMQHAVEISEGASKDLLKERSAPYDSLTVPEGVVVQVPQLALWFVFVAGMVAICAMILPGISGSYILLIFGVYFFILNALKGFLTTLMSGEIPVSQGAFVIVFCLGCGIGVLSFSRVMSYLLHSKPLAPPTLGLLVGLMVGCLRGIWPFRHLNSEGVEINFVPVAVSGTVGVAIGAALVGAILVTGLSRIGARLEVESQEGLQKEAAPEINVGGV